jgi:LysM repeat protein
LETSNKSGERVTRLPIAEQRCRIFARKIAIFFWAFLSITEFAATAIAGPVKDAKGQAPSTSGWVRHRVIPGELLAEIGGRYAVSVAEIVRWNNLNKEKPFIRAGQELRIKTEVAPPPIEKTMYQVRPGDSWERIAKQNKISANRLHLWNSGQSDELHPGDKLVLWTEAKDGDRKSKKKSAEHPNVPIVPVKGTAESIGSPNRGRLSGAALLPENPALYTRRNATNSYGSAHTIELIQKALSIFRSETGFTREVLICDMSRKNGGRFRPHASHQSGRDVDIQLPCRPEVKPGTVPWAISQVDWEAAWGLTKAIIETGEVQYIFLSRDRQVKLYEAAQHLGESAETLDKIIQYPRNERVAIVRHDPGHIKHMHVRFKCGKTENACLER